MNFQFHEHVWTPLAINISSPMQIKYINCTITTVTKSKVIVLQILLLLRTNDLWQLGISCYEIKIRQILYLSPFLSEKITILNPHVLISKYNDPFKISSIKILTKNGNNKNQGLASENKIE